MRQKQRWGFSVQEKTEPWDRWIKGESLTDIARTFGKTTSSIYGQLSPHGGIRPPPRQRSRLALTLMEREEISRGIAKQRSLRCIASHLGRSAATICREINRNGGYDHYRATLADEQAWRRARRPKACKLVTHDPLSRLVAQKLSKSWSPRQIDGWLKRE